jgi:hypothetical protein
VSSATAGARRAGEERRSSSTANGPGATASDWTPAPSATGEPQESAGSGAPDSNAAAEPATRNDNVALPIRTRALPHAAVKVRAGGALTRCSPRMPAISAIPTAR